jgi:hypothetical protein
MDGVHQNKAERNAGQKSMFLYRSLLLIVISILAGYAASAAQGGYTLTGRVTDQFDAVIVAAVVVITDTNGKQTRTTTAPQGRYTFGNLSPGAYIVRVEAQGFEVFEQSVHVSGNRKEVDIRLKVGFETQNVSSKSDAELSTESDNNRSALILREADLEGLPQDPEELAAALRALGSAPVGPDGGQILIDGFLNTGQPLPPITSIREVRINTNPFSAENDRLGFGQIQIITRPGTEKFRGQAFFNFNDESLNARNPFARSRAAYQMRNLGGNFSGPIRAGRASFFLTVDHRHTNDNAIINAIVLSPSLVPEPFIRTVIVPRNQINFTARLDVQVNSNHTLNTRYSFYRNRSRNAGVGGISLFERAFNFTLPIHTIQVTETAVLNNRLINEFRLQYIGEDQINTPLSTRPGLTVQGSFASGGSVLGFSTNPEGRLTVQNSILWTTGAHTVRAGVRIRRTTILDNAPDFFNGAFSFTGSFAPLLDVNGEPVRDASGQTIPVLINSLERYRRTLFFSQRMLSPAEIRARGGGASQLILAGGDPIATATQVDFGSYIQDDWKVAPNFTLSFGLRTEFQTNIPLKLNLAPRVAFGWGLDAQKGSTPKTVMRGGFGIFFDRFNENQVAVASQYQSASFQNFVVTDPAILDSFPNVPSIETVALSNAGLQSVFRLADDLRVPYLLQTAIGIERQLPLKTIITAGLISSRTLHALRTRNINAPVLVREASGVVSSRARPEPDAGDVLQYESSGRLNQNQLLVTLNNRFSRRMTFYATYTLNKAMGDTDGFWMTPADSYDVSTEYGRSAFDVRQTFSGGGTFEGPLGLKLSPLVFVSSGRPFNITTGADSNEDSFFTERPSLATDLTKPGIRTTRFGAFDPEPALAQAVIPRNFGQAPGYFIVNLNVSRTFVFPKANNATSNATPANEGFRLTLNLRILNVFNRPNFDLPVGNLSSPFFGQSVMTAGNFGAASIGNPAAGNRRIETQVRFEF